MKRIIVGNWKMYVAKPDAAKKFAQTLRKRATLLKKHEVVIAAPATLIPVLAPVLGKSARLGAQTVSAFPDGAHTGDISAAMLKQWGVTHVIVGHSERRHAGESNEIVREQLWGAQAAGLTTILCIGEEERDPAGSHFSHIASQIESALAPKAGTKPLSAAKLRIAYEPVWAIGKEAKEAMEPHELEEMAIFIRKTLVEVLGREVGLKVPILYGGSVDESNAAPLLGEGGVAGFLLGRASASADSFIAILTLCK